MEGVFYCLKVWLSGKVLSQYLGAEVLEKIAQPIEFKWIYPGAKQTEPTIKGYGADILIDVSNAILAAEAAGTLRGHQANLAKQARVILNASAKSGITSLVYALAGYRPEIEEVNHSVLHKHMRDLQNSQVCSARSATGAQRTPFADPDRVLPSVALDHCPSWRQERTDRAHGHRDRNQ